MVADLAVNWAAEKQSILQLLRAHLSRRATAYPRTGFVFGTPGDVFRARNDYVASC